MRLIHPFLTKRAFLRFFYPRFPFIMTVRTFDCFHSVIIAVIVVVVNELCYDNYEFKKDLVLARNDL